METTLLPLYEASHPDLLGNPFYSAERFAERVRGYMKAPGFELSSPRWKALRAVWPWATRCPRGPAGGEA
jgi:hypothetical protein